MKKLSFVFVFLLFASVIFIGCKKVQLDKNTPDKSIIQDAKNYFNALLVKEKAIHAGRTTSQRSSDQPMPERIKAMNVFLNWGEAKEYNTGEIDYVIAPVKHDAKPFNNKSFEAAKNLVFYEDKSGKMHMNVIEILSDKGTSLGSNVQELISTAFTNMYLGKSKSTVNINANVIFYNEDYIAESSYKITNGAWSASKVALQNKLKTGNRQGNRTAAIYEHWVTIGYWYDLATGVIVDWVILAEWDVCVSDCPNPDTDPFGGNGCSNCAPAPNSNDPCAVAKIGADAATNFSTNGNFTTAKTNIQAVASSDGKEHGIAFGKDANGTSITSSITTGNDHSGSFGSVTNRFADLHNHPNNSPPSSGDLYGFIDNAISSYLYETRYIVTQNGTVYALTITDIQAATNFNINYPRVPNPGYEPGFPDSLVDEINQLKGYFGASEEMAMAFILGKYNAGVALLKQDNNGNFKRLNTTETIDANGNKTYVANNCQ